MAKEVDPSRQRQSSVYPWDELLDGRTWELKRGKDFDENLRAKAVCAAAWAAAKKRNLKVSCTIEDPDTVIITAFKLKPNKRGAP